MRWRECRCDPSLPLGVLHAGESLLDGDASPRAASRALRGLVSCEQGLQRKAAALNKIARQAHGGDDHFEAVVLVCFEMRRLSILPASMNAITSSKSPASTPPLS